MCKEIIVLSKEIIVLSKEIIKMYMEMTPPKIKRIHGKLYSIEGFNGDRGNEIRTERD